MLTACFLSIFFYTKETEAVVPPERRKTFIRLHGIISENIIMSSILRLFVSVWSGQLIAGAKITRNLAMIRMLRRHENRTEIFIIRVIVRADNTTIRY
jgi:hypothetical protein